MTNRMFLSLLCLVVSLFHLANTNAQNSFLDNTQWQCAQRGFEPTYYIRFYNYVKDTIIANKSYAKIENTLLVRNMLEGKRIVQTDEPLFVRENDGYVWRLYN